MCYRELHSTERAPEQLELNYAAKISLLSSDRIDFEHHGCGIPDPCATNQLAVRPQRENP
jgi:hypothetical protein